MITTTRFLAYHHRIASAARALDDERASRAELLRAFEADGGNGAALRLVMRLAALDDEGAADFVADFCTYCDWLGIGGRQGGSTGRGDWNPRSHRAADRGLDAEIAGVGGSDDDDDAGEGGGPDVSTDWPDAEDAPE